MNLFAILIVLTMLGKLIIHFYLDYTRKNNDNLKSFFIGGFSPLELIFWYMEPVDSKYNLLKKICNFLFIVSWLLLITSLFIH